MNSKNYESWKLEGMPYCYGQSFEIEYNDLDSWGWSRWQRDQCKHMKQEILIF